MTREFGQPENPDNDSTWANFASESSTKGAPPSRPNDIEATLPVESTEDHLETVEKKPRRGNGEDSGESSPMSSFAGGIDQDPTRDWDALPPPIFEPGQTVFGKYKLIEMLGEGGMGQVWLVENIQLDCKSALKLIKPEIAKSDKAWKRFKREAQVMAKLNHPNAVAVRDFARAQSIAYIEMEYIRGKSLDKMVEDQKGKPLPLDWIAPIVDQLCSLLQEAHEHVDEKSGKPRPIIHRDLKPSNLMLLERKSPGQDLKVLDFGIAKMADDDRESNLTGDAEFIGTAAYSSPEQIRSEPIDGRSDLYSFGVMLYQFLTGDLPFPGGPRRALVAHLMEAPRPFQQANPSAVVPPKIEALVLQCLEKNVDNRPRSAGELRRRFREVIEETNVGARPSKKGASSYLVPLVVVGVLAMVAIGVAINALNQPIVIKVVEPSKSKNVDGASSAAAPTSDVVPPTPPVVIDNPKWKLPDGFTRSGEDLPDGPRAIERKAGRVPFVRHASGIYLPIGFEIVENEGESGEMPTHISRGSGAGLMRFRRIQGGRFQMGNISPDIAAESPGLDLQDQPVLPHWVDLSAFYILETEVTNGQIEAFLKELPGVLKEEKLENWKRYRDLLASRDGVAPAMVNTYPAICLDWETAKTFSEKIGGLLPTEAQWEFAARSEGKPKRFATKGTVGRNTKPPANLFYGLDVAQMPAKTFEKDVTEQGIHDMTGNVREWCRDGYEPNSKTIGPSTEIGSALVDPCLTAVVGPNGASSCLRVGLWRVNESDFADGTKYVVRGGSFQTEPDIAANFQRDAEPGGESVKDLGFRVVIELPTVIPVP